MKQLRTIVYQKARRTTLLLLAIVLAVSGVAFGLSSPQADAATATVIREQRENDRTLDLFVSSPSIDSWYKNVRIITPEGWSKDSSKKWPALWLFHGGMDDYNSWYKNTTIKDLVAKKGVAVVMPDTSWCSAYSDWYNGGKGGKPAWETYLTNDLRNLLDQKYNIDGSNAAAAGLSMGGLGALKLTAQHPDMFKGVASFSGNADTLHSYNNTADGPDLPGLSCLADWKRVWGDYRIAEQRKIWQRNNPYDLADRFAQAKYVYISSGDGVENPLNSGNVPDPVEKQVNVEGRELVKKLESLNIPVESNFTGGTHTWPYWQQNLERALPGLLKAINVE